MTEKVTLPFAIHTAIFLLLYLPCRAIQSSSLMVWRHDVFRFAQNDVARFTRNDAMFASMCPQAHIIRRSRHHWHSQHHLRDRQTSLKKARSSERAFFCERAVKRCINAGKNSKKYTRKLLDKLEFT